MNRPASGPDGANLAAAYVRMSTARQDQSISLQLDYIARYAAAAGCEVVKVYRDDAKSGLSADHRHGLRQMIDDIGGGNPGFDRVLVYDVSRWGRFQDIDESAYFEFLCCRNGIRVVYCAEHFANDGSPLAHIIKSVKRIMAGEFSRALSARTFEAQAFLLARGFKPGGVAGYGLRRLSVMADGRVRRMLEAGERKCYPTDRVVLALGPDAEVRTVRRIFQLYTVQGLSFRAVAGLLNGEGVAFAPNLLWSETRVRTILTNEKYCGNLMYNRSTARLGTKRRANDSSLWLRKEVAHAPIVTVEEFAAARDRHRMRCGLSPELVLARLRAIHARCGTLSYRLLDAEPGMPHVALVKKMFGSLHRAYVLALEPVGADLACIRVSAARATLLRACDDARACIVRAGRDPTRTSRPSVISIDGRISLRIAATVCRSRAGVMGWVVPARASNTDFVICALLDCSGQAVDRYVLLPGAANARKQRWINARDPESEGMTSSPMLDALFGLPTKLS